MKTLFFSVVVFLMFNILNTSAQTQRMNHVAIATNYAVENRATTNLNLLRKAEQQIQKEDFMNAMLTLDSAVNQYPNSAEALLLRARLKKIMGESPDSDIELATKINPYIADLYGFPTDASVIGLISNVPQAAIQPLTVDQKLNYYYIALDDMAVKKLEINQEMEKIEAILLLMENGNLVEAKESLNDLITILPSSAIAHDLMGTINLKQGNVIEAKNSFSKAINIFPDFAIAWYNLGQIERMNGNYILAKEHIDKAISLKSNLSKAYFESALLNKKLGNAEAALVDYNKVIEMNGENYMEAYLNRGLTKKMLGDYNGAIMDIEKAIEEFPYNAELYKNRGNLQLIFGLKLKAIDDYTKAIQLDSDYAEAYFNRAIAQLQLFNRVSACYDFEKSIELGYERAMEMQTYFCAD